ncbi:AGE family epimerase/isomerase [Demequina sp. NBRC 110052]|uniref:AGE family epimerase/isomerase n=1 Tax=Demequina sp. NBRC 110052 TaxID=1570341 RepID=UPI000A034893|nr:AGE family epimerase/isomerase [Demequina sp. NBRC 110052]
MTVGDARYLAAQRADLLRFAAKARVDEGFGWLDDLGRVVPAQGVQLWITCRMTHTAALGLLADEPSLPGGPRTAELAELVDHGVRSLSGLQRDDENGGWFARVGEGRIQDDAKEAYGHAFVVLAASSALAAGRPGADALLEDALEVLLGRFWESETGLAVDRWDAAWTRCDDYRGINANMHTVEALLAAGDVLGDSTLHARAERIVERVVDWARPMQWRIPEHFTRDWEPMLEHHADQPAHPFQPYGATVGHGIEWARLIAATHATVGVEGEGLLDAAVSLYDRAVADGWHADGADGFVYTTDWAGKPVVAERMHWVAAEAANTASVLAAATGESRFDDDVARWWAYIDAYLVDESHGSWRHELDPHNRPSATVWTGKPDIYHAYQAALLPELPIAPAFAQSLRLRSGVR